MAKYLDSKGLSYLWQKIKHAYVSKDTVIKLGSDGDLEDISLVTSSAAGASDSWTIPFATSIAEPRMKDGVPETDADGKPVFDYTVKRGIVRTGDSTVTTDPTGETWHKAPIVDGYVWYENTLASTDTVTSNDSLNLTNNYVILGAGDKKVKASAYLIGAESYTTPAFGGANLLATEAAVKEYADTVTSGLQLTYTDGDVDTDLAGKKVIKLTDTNNASLSWQLDATPFIKDGMLESVQILKHDITTTTNEGGETVETKVWKTLEGVVVEGLIDAPSNAADDSIWMYFVWKTVHHDPNNVDTDLTTKTASWLPATDLIKECSADNTKGIDAVTNEDGGNKFYVKTTEDGVLAGANVSTGFDASGNVVGYIDVESYLEPFSQKDLDDIFASAETLYGENHNSPIFPTDDPLAPTTPEEPVQPAE